MKDRQIAYISKQFLRNAKIIYPSHSIYGITKELNKILEKMVYEKKR